MPELLIDENDPLIWKPPNRNGQIPEIEEEENDPLIWKPPARNAPSETIPAPEKPVWHFNYPQQEIQGENIPITPPTFEESILEQIPFRYEMPTPPVKPLQQPAEPGAFPEPVPSAPEQGEIYATPPKTLGEKAKEFFISPPVFGEEKPLETFDRYMNTVYQWGAKPFASFGLGTTFTGPFVNPKEEKLSPYKAPTGAKMLNDLTEFAGQIYTATHLLGLAPPTATATTPAIKETLKQTLSRMMPSWAASGALDALSEGIANKRSPEVIAKDVMMKGGQRAAEAIPWAAFDKYLMPKIWPALQKTIPQVTNRVDDYFEKLRLQEMQREARATEKAGGRPLTEKVTQAHSAARQEVATAWSNFQANPNPQTRANWDAVRAKYTGAPASTVSVPAEQATVTKEFGKNLPAIPGQVKPYGAIPTVPPTVPTTAPYTERRVEITPTEPREIVKFGALKKGDKFVLNGMTYKKTTGNVARDVDNKPVQFKEDLDVELVKLKERATGINTKAVGEVNNQILQNEAYKLAEEGWNALGKTVSLNPKDPIAIPQSEYNDLKYRFGGNKTVMASFRPAQPGERHLNIDEWYEQNFSFRQAGGGAEGERTAPRIPGYEDRHPTDVFLDAVERAYYLQQGKKGKLNTAILNDAIANKTFPPAIDLQWYLRKKDLIRQGRKQEQIDFAEKEFYDSMQKGAEYAYGTGEKPGEGGLAPTGQNIPDITAQSELEEERAALQGKGEEATDAEIEDFTKGIEEEEITPATKAGTPAPAPPEGEGKGEAKLIGDIIKDIPTFENDIRSEIQKRAGIEIGEIEAYGSRLTGISHKTGLPVNPKSDIDLAVEIKGVKDIDAVNKLANEGFLEKMGFWEGGFDYKGYKVSVIPVPEGEVIGGKKLQALQPPAPPAEAKQAWEMTSTEYEKAVKTLDTAFKLKDGRIINTGPIHNLPKGIDIKDVAETGFVNKAGQFLTRDEVFRLTGASTGEELSEVQAEREEPLYIAHKAEIERALSEGKPIPPEVLAEYPELQGKAGEIKPTGKITKSEKTGGLFGQETREDMAWKGKQQEFLDKEKYLTEKAKEEIVSQADVEGQVKFGEKIPPKDYVAGLVRKEPSAIAISKLRVPAIAKKLESLYTPQQVEKIYKEYEKADKLQGVKQPSMDALDRDIFMRKLLYFDKDVMGIVNKLSKESDWGVPPTEPQQEIKPAFNVGDKVQIAKDAAGMLKDAAGKTGNIVDIKYKKNGEVDMLAVDIDGEEFIVDNPKDATKISGEGGGGLKGGFVAIPKALQKAVEFAKQITYPAEAILKSYGTTGKKLTTRAKRATERAKTRAAKAIFFTEKTLQGLTAEEQKLGKAFSQIAYEKNLKELQKQKVTPQRLAHFKKRGVHLRAAPISTKQEQAAEKLLNYIDSFRTEYEKAGGELLRYGIAWPQRFTKEGEKLYAEIHDAVGPDGIPDWKVLRENAMIKEMITTGAAIDVGQAYKLIRNIKYADYHPVFGYFEKAKSPIPPKYLQFDATKVLNKEFWGRLFQHLEFTKEFGPGYTLAYDYIHSIKNTYGESVGNTVQQWWDNLIQKPVEKAEWQKISDKLAYKAGQYQALKLSPFTSIQNFFQRFLTAMDFGVRPTIKGAISVYRKGERLKAAETGAVPFDPFESGIIADIKSGEGAILAKLWIDAIGMGPTEKGNNITSAIAAQSGLIRDLEDLATKRSAAGQIARNILSLGGQSKGAIKRRLKRHDIDWRKALKRGYLTAEELEIASIRQAESKQFRADLFATPLWWQKSAWARQIFGKYRIPFAYNMLGKCWKVSATEASKGNFRPLIALLLITTISGEVYNLWRKGLLGENREEMPLYKRLWEDIVDGGAVSLFSTFMYGRTFAEVAYNAVTGVHGATVKNVLQTAEKIKEAPEHTPRHLLNYVEKEIPTVKYIDQMLNRSEHIRQYNRRKMAEYEKELTKKEGELYYYYDDIYNSMIEGEPEKAENAIKRAIELGADGPGIMSAMEGRKPSKAAYEKRPELTEMLTTDQEKLLKELEKEHDIAVHKVRKTLIKGKLLKSGESDFIMQQVGTIASKKMPEGEKARAKQRLRNIYRNKKKEE